MEVEQSKRIFGLDLLRSIAILIVVVEHSLPLVSTHFEVLNHLALPDGVDLFFVLSGFLIGGKLLTLITHHNNFEFKQLLAFLKRRWLRTLPNYFLFLLLNIVLVYFSLIKGTLNSYLFSYFCFLQNVFLPLDFLFWESWSLAVEEWYYLLFPLLLFVLLQLKLLHLSIKNTVLCSILLLMIFPLLYRLYSLSCLPSHHDWDLYYRKLVATRLDAMGYGLFAAYIKHQAPRMWKFGKTGWFFAGCLGLFLLTYFSSAIHEQYVFSRSLYFSLSAFLVLLLLPQLDALQHEPFTFQPFAFISRVSYAMYLLHLPLYQLMFSNFQNHSPAVSLLWYCAYLALTIYLSYLVYRFFETRFLINKS